MRDQPDISERDLADIAALADGSLPAERRSDVEARVRATPTLAAELDRQTRAVQAIVAAQRQVGAPADLRARVATERQARRPARSRRRWGFATGAVAVAAAAVVIALMVVPSGLTGGQLLAEAAATHARPAQQAPPGVQNDALLALQEFGVTFPNWTGEFEWDATGRRSDRVDGRDVETVTYGKDGKTVGYSVIDGGTVDPPGSARELTVEGVQLSVFTEGDRTIMVFDREGHTCVLSAVGVPEETLTKLAVWKGDGAVAF